MRKDLRVYSKLGFMPMYSASNTVVIAVYRLTKEILEFVDKRYKNYCFMCFEQQVIYQMLFNNIQEDYRHKVCASHLKKYHVIIFLVILPVFLNYNIINIIYFAAILFKLMTTLCGWRHRSSQRTNITNYPIYTILIPIKNEKLITIKSLLEALSKLSYPSDKLDVKLIVEESDWSLIEKIDTPYDVVKVPYSLPQTKAKACNYAMQFALGEYITIYDADDRPHPLQLQRVLEIFHSNPGVSCVQSPLNYYNYNDNILTKCFALEYSNLFDFSLQGMNSLNLPILLGGTSNHFRREVLEKIGKWDPYNVTEDADLGIKLKREGYKIHILHEYHTLEEAPIKLSSWLKQRARWIKGFIITYIMHMKNPLHLISAVGIKSFIAIQFLIFIPIIIFLLTPWFLIMHIIMLDGISPNTYIFTLINLVFYISVTLFTSLLSIKQHKWWKLLLYSLSVPFYNLLHSIASYRSIWQLLFAPYRWDKTEHNQSSKK